MPRKSTVLVTGASGFLGTRLTRRLVDEGYEVRVLARRQSDLSALKKLAIAIVEGDLGSEASVAAAVAGADVVVHAGAGTSGSAKDADIATIRGTRNVLDACKSHSVTKLVYISSCSVYEVAGYADDQVVTEEAQLERHPGRRGHYSAAKLRAEDLVRDAIARGSCPTVVLRLGMLYGTGTSIFTSMMGISLARRLFLVFGTGSSEVPLLHVDNAVDAIVECLHNGAADDQVFNVVDHPVSKREYMERAVRPLYPGAMAIYCPMFLLLAATWLQEKVFSILGKQPPLTVYRLMSSQRRVRYSTAKIESVMGWRPHISFEQGAGQMVREHSKDAAGR